MTNATQELTPQGAVFIAQHEGFVPRWYLDPVGIPTIGHGFTWRSSSFRKWWGENRKGQTFKEGATMTREEASEVLRLLVSEEYGPPVTKAWGRVAPHVFDGGSSVCFNAGARSLSWKWSQAIKAGQISKGAKLLTTTAVTAAGRRLQGLVNRRKMEAVLIEFGEYGHATLPPTKADHVLRRGSRGQKVAELLRDLQELGYYDGTLDDIFGRGAEAAVLAFQRAEELKADGRVGPVTSARIDARMGGDTTHEPTASRASALARLIEAIIAAFGGS